jgi:hypothetical protein
VGGVVERLLRLEPGERAQARGAADVGVDEAGPRGGQLEQRSVWPVGAVSKMTWSNARRSRSSPSSLENSSNAAISTVHAPESCSSMLRSAAVGSTPR